MSLLTFDHYTIKVKDLEDSVRFYSTVLGLHQIKNRTQKDYIRWFSMGGTSELHVVEGEGDINTDIGMHLAFRLADFDAFFSRLRKYNVTLHNSKGVRDTITTRADGVRQVYFQDPDGYWIEVNEAGVKASSDQRR